MARRNNVKEATLVMALLVGACASSESSNRSAAPIAGEDGGLVDPTCSLQDDAFLREGELPSGTPCTHPKAECRFSKSVTCTDLPGAQYVPAAPTKWHCTCGATQWGCEVVGGGFGVILCPDFDAGADSGMVTDAGDADSDAGH